ncbi:MAG: hypothetical protein H0U74_15385 [Bradymonadaceae bacterium]|nr:hypothetical protein [Lujinxingiaceae bacterium]
MKHRLFVTLGLCVSLLAPVAVQAQDPIADAEIEDAESSDSTFGDYLLQLTGGKPSGTNIGTLTHASFSYGFVQVSGHPLLTGFSYSERGGWMGQLILVMLAGAAAQDQANRERRTVSYEVPSERLSFLGFSIDYLTGSEADAWGRAALMRANVDWMISFKKGGWLPLPEGLPFTLSIGLMLVGRHVPPSEGTGGQRWGDIHLGLSLITAYPITRWGQLDLSVFGGGDIVSEARAGGTLHLGNRFFVAGGLTFVPDYSGTEFRLGMRL